MYSSRLIKQHSDDYVIILHLPPKLRRKSPKPIPKNCKLKLHSIGTHFIWSYLDVKYHWVGYFTCVCVCQELIMKPLIFAAFKSNRAFVFRNQLTFLRKVEACASLRKALNALIDFQLRHPNIPTKLNLVSTWLDQFDQALLT